MAWNAGKVKRLIAVVALAGIPLVTTASCDPYTGRLEIYRDDDHHHRDWGFFDIFVSDDYYYDDCYYGCYDDGYEIYFRAHT